MSCGISSPASCWLNLCCHRITTLARLELFVFGVFMAVIIPVQNTRKCLHLEVVKANFVVKYLTLPIVALIAVNQRRVEM